MKMVYLMLTALKKKRRYCLKEKASLGLSLLCISIFFWQAAIFSARTVLLTVSMAVSVSSLLLQVVASFYKTLLMLMALWTLFWNWLITFRFLSFLTSSSSLSLDLKNLRTRESGFLASSLNFPYQTETPYSRMRIQSAGSTIYRFLVAMMTITPCACFSLKIFSTRAQEEELRLLKGLSRMQISAEEQNTLAKAIFCS